MADVSLDLAGLTPIYYPVAVPVGAATNHLVTGRALVAGWNIINPGAAAERVDFYDGADATTTRIGGAIVPASGTVDRTGPTPGIYCQAGVTAIVAGADLVIVMYVATFD